MNRAVVALAVVTLATGLKAAYHWHEASQVQPDPGWTEANPEPVVPELRQMQWNGAIIDSANRSAALNKVAAIWTAVSVLLGAIASVVGAF